MKWIRGILIGLNRHLIPSDVLILTWVKSSRIRIFIAILIFVIARRAHLEERQGRSDSYTIAATVLAVHCLHIIGLVSKSLCLH